MINTEGLSKAEVLAALYNGSKTWRPDYSRKKIDWIAVKTAQLLISDYGTYFKCLYGKILEVDLNFNKEFNEKLYDEYNGSGTAKNAIKNFRKAKIITMKNEFKNYKREAIEAAEDLCYSKDTIVKLNHAKSTIELTNIMTTERIRLMELEY